MNKTIRNLTVVGLALLLGACASTGTGYQPLPPVKVITETVEVEIYAPPYHQQLIYKMLIGKLFQTILADQQQAKIRKQVYIHTTNMKKKNTQLKKAKLKLD